MSTISAAAVKILRDRTNAPMMDCKAALTEASGDMEKAIEILRKKNKAMKMDWATGEGRIAAFIDPNQKVGAIIEVRCESAPVANCEPFVKLCQELAKQVALKNPDSVDALLAQPYYAEAGKTVKDHIAEVYNLIRETMVVGRFARLTGLLGEYVHFNGTSGALLKVEGEKAAEDLLHDVCIHITANNPVAARREEVPQDVIEREKEIAKAQAAATGKPANIIDKIAEGKMKTWFAENVLVEQPFVKDDSKTVGDLLKSAGLTMPSFVRYKVGEVGS